MFMRRFREPVNGFSHLGGALLALIGLIGLIAATWQTPGKMISLFIYGASLVLIYSASSALHLTHGSERTLDVLNRIDHAAIYVLIAGTYTPFCYNLLSGAWRWGMLILVWGLAAAGAIYMLIFLGKSRWLMTFLYLAMGWVALIGAPHILATLPGGAIALLAAGGIVYTVGAIIFALEKPNLHRYFGYHELWHVFVMVASAIQFLAVVRYVV